jgi:hypothetical protein
MERNVSPAPEDSGRKNPPPIPPGLRLQNRPLTPARKPTT